MPHGRVEAEALEVLIPTLDLSAPFLPHFSATGAGMLNDLAQRVNHTAPGSLSSPFSRLSFAEKVAVFQIMDGTDSLKSLAGVLPVDPALKRQCGNLTTAFSPQLFPAGIIRLFN